MVKKPTYEEMEQKNKELEEQILKLKGAEKFIKQYGKDHSDLSWDEVFDYVYRLDGKPMQEKVQGQKDEAADDRKKKSQEAAATAGTGMDEQAGSQDAEGLQYPDGAPPEKKSFLDHARRNAYKGMT